MKFSELYNNLKITNPYDKEVCFKIICYLSQQINNQIDFITYRNAPIDFDFKTLATLYQKFQNGFPIEYLLKTVNCFKTDFFIQKGVFIPRKETEFEIYSLAQTPNLKFKKILDLCCGSGIITSYLKSVFKNATVIGIDKSKLAIKTCKINCQILNVNVDFVYGNIFKKMKKYADNVDFVFFNPPYISKKYQLEKNVLKEPKQALFAKEDGIYFYKNFFNNYFKFFSSQTKFLIEFGFDQKKAITKILLDNGINNFVFKKDLYNNDRFLLINF